MTLESGQLTTGEQRQSNQDLLFNLIITTNCGKSGKSRDNQIILKGSYNAHFPQVDINSLES